MPLETDDDPRVVRVESDGSKTFIPRDLYELRLRHDRATRLLMVALTAANVVGLLAATAFLFVGSCYNDNMTRHLIRNLVMSAYPEPATALECASNIFEFAVPLMQHLW